MVTTLQLDFVSDVSCPWCVIGLRELERALERLAGVVAARIAFQPFELNPNLPREGEDAAAHLAAKYGLAPADIARAGAQLTARGAALGFEFRLDRRERLYNTFDAHRLLYWAGERAGGQRELQHALFAAYFSAGADLSSTDVLAAVAGRAGLDPAEARAVLESGRYEAEVREREQYYRARGIDAVPSVIVGGRHLIQGGQPSGVFEQALRRLATPAAAPASRVS